MVRNYGAGVGDVCGHLAPLLNDEKAKKALEILNRDFSEPDLIGPSRVAQFLYGGPDPDLRADVAGFVRDLLYRCEQIQG